MNQVFCLICLILYIIVLYALCFKLPAVPFFCVRMCICIIFLLFKIQTKCFVIDEFHQHIGKKSNVIALLFFHYGTENKMYSHINFIFLLFKSQRNVPVFNKRKALNAVQLPVLKFF